MKRRMLAFVLAACLILALLPGAALTAKALTPSEAELYIPIVERVLEASIECAGDFMVPAATRGILYDVDEDGVTELILSYPSKVDETRYWVYAYGVYDIERGKVVTLAEDVTFNASAAAAGSDGYTGVALYKGEPVLITCREGGETSRGGGVKYPAWTCDVEVYSFDSFRKIGSLSVETTHEEILFHLDGRSVTEKAFLKEMENYSYLEYKLRNDIWVSMKNTIEKKPLDELLEYLEDKAASSVSETTQAPAPETTPAPEPTDPPATKPAEQPQDTPAATKPAEQPQANRGEGNSTNWLWIIIGILAVILFLIILVKAWKLIMTLLLIAVLAVGALFLIRNHSGESSDAQQSQQTNVPVEQVQKQEQTVPVQTPTNPPQPEGELIASGTCGEKVTWQYYSDGVLVISGRGKMTDYGTGEMPWDDYRDILVSVVIESGVTSVGNFAFSEFRNIHTVSLPDTLETIGICAFQHCDVLANVAIPEGVATIESHAFYGCESLPDLVIPATVKKIGIYAFVGSYDPKNIYIMNKKCEIEDEANTLGIAEAVVIHGYAGSTAEKYAEKYNYQFVVLDK